MSGRREKEGLVVSIRRRGKRRKECQQAVPSSSKLRSTTSSQTTTKKKRERGFPGRKRRTAAGRVAAERKMMKRTNIAKKGWEINGTSIEVKHCEKKKMNRRGSAAVQKKKAPEKNRRGPLNRQKK